MSVDPNEFPGYETGDDQPIEEAEEDEVEDKRS